jgi:hypothetical protein
MKLRNFALATATLALGCGSASADLYLFDAPPPGVKAVNIQVASMDVHVDADFGKTDSVAADDTSIDNDSKWESLTVDKNIDLVQHQGETAAELLGQLDLPEGKITQLRLVIDVSDPTKNFVTFTDPASPPCNLDTTRVARQGIKVNHVFKVFQASKGDKHEIYVDFDLATSLTQTATCFAVEPQLQIRKVVSNGKPEPI